MNDFEKMLGIGGANDLFGSALLEGLMRNHANHGASFSDLFQGDSGKKDERAMLLEKAKELKDSENFIMESQLSAKKLEIMNLKKAIRDSFGMVKDLYAEVTRLDKEGAELASSKAEQGLELQRTRREKVRLEKYNESLQGAVDSLRNENDSKRDEISSLVGVLNAINAIDAGAVKPDLKQAVENLQQIAANLLTSNSDFVKKSDINNDESVEETAANNA